MLPQHLTNNDNKLTEAANKEAIMSDTLNSDNTLQEFIPVASENKVKRMSPGTLDDYYIDNYIEDPRCKVKALRKAARQAKAGINVTRQKAYQIHKRLSYRIEQIANERMLEGGLVGFNILMKLAIGSELDNVRAMCASKLVEYAGKNKPVDIKVIKDRGDIKAEIEQTKARILSITGKKDI